MSVLIEDMEMPKGYLDIRIYADGRVVSKSFYKYGEEIGTAIQVGPNGRLIDADALRQAMYHEAFETDSPMQKWDSGCWIRYKMFERLEENAPTIIPASDKDINVLGKEEGE